MRRLTVRLSGNRPDHRKRRPDQKAQPADAVQQSPAPSGGKYKESFARGTPVQHSAPRRNPEYSNGHLGRILNLCLLRKFWIRILILRLPRMRRG